MLAYILVQTQSSQEQELMKKLSEDLNVVDINVVFGEWDVVVLVEMDNPQSIGQFVIDNIRSEPHVVLTSTLIVAQ